MYFPIDFQAQLSWQAKEVIKELDDKPHMLTRIEISGTFFPHRAAEPFIRIVVSKRKTVTNWFTDVSEDNKRLMGYFPVDLPNEGIIEFGYGAKVMGRIPKKFNNKDIDRLDRGKLLHNPIVVETALLKKKQRLTP